MTVTSGLKCLGLCRNSGPLGSLVKMLLGSSAWSSPARLLEWRAEALTASRTVIITRRHGFSRKTCCSWNSSETSKGSDTKSRHLLYRLVPSEPPTVGTGLPLWPTPTAGLGEHGGPNARDSSGRPGLQMAAMIWPTPDTMCCRDGQTRRAEARGRHAVSLNHAVKMWPTPSASDCGRTAINPHLTKNGTIRHIGKNGKQSYARLDAVAVLFPTPIATDWKNRGCRDYRKNREHQLQTEIGGQLNPAWVEWLMGFPPGWTDIG